MWLSYDRYKIGDFFSLCVGTCQASAKIGDDLFRRHLDPDPVFVFGGAPVIMYCVCTRSQCKRERALQPRWCRARFGLADSGARV